MLKAPQPRYRYRSISSGGAFSARARVDVVLIRKQEWQRHDPKRVAILCDNVWRMSGSEMMDKNGMRKR